MTFTARTLLIVDDDALFADALSQELASGSLEVLSAGTGAEALQICRERKIDVVLLDQKLPDAEGHRLCPALLEANEGTKIIFATAYPNFQNAMDAIRAGAFDYLSKPCEVEQVSLSVGRCLRTLDLERSASVKKYRESLESAAVELVGADGGLHEVAALVRLAASSGSPVLITGETGTGKSLVARAIHLAGPRAAGEFVAVNCAALPETLIESELFGYEKGAFTGASHGREGLIEMSEGGTLFLDEIAEMPPSLQTRLLHVLEERSIRRVGGRNTRAVDFRLLSATNANVEQAVAERRLRPDLYYRLDVLRIHVPPLRERRQDIPALAAHFLERLGGREGRAAVADAELQRLQAYDWPGNLRELRNVLERSLLIHRGSPLRPSAFLESTSRPPSPLAAMRETPAARPASPVPPQPLTDPLPLEEVERQHVEAVLRHTAGNLARAARLLGISVSTLRRKIRG